MTRFVYLDEAGTSGNADDPRIVVAGIIVHGDKQLTELYASLDQIARDLVPEYPGLVFHACDVYGRRGKFFGNGPLATLERRRPILDALAHLPRRHDLKIVASSIGLEEVKRDTARAQIICYASCVGQANHWLRETAPDENCLVIAEDNNVTRADIRRIHRNLQDKEFVANMGQSVHRFFPFDRVREDPAFQGKRPGNPLVLADFLAFTLKRYMNGDPCIKQFVEPWKAGLQEAT